jgi:hypothetical protein
MAQLTVRTAGPVLAGAVLLASSALYATGNPTVVAALCEWHFPNTTVPRRFRGAVGEPCVLYGPRAEFQGVLWSDGEQGSGFVSGLAFGEAAAWRGRIGDPGFALLFDPASDRDGLLRAVRGDPPRAGRVLVTLYGWPSRSEGRFGRRGEHGQQILVDRIVGAAPAPEPDFGPRS